MGYFRYTLKCTRCGEQWASYFMSVNMTQGAQDCPKCGTVNHKDEYGYNPITKVADEWEFHKVDKDGNETGETYWH